MNNTKYTRNQDELCTNIICIYCDWKFEYFYYAMKIVLALLIITTVVQLMITFFILGLFTLTFVKTVFIGEKWECNKLEDDRRVS